MVKVGGSVVGQLSDAWWDDAATIAATRPVVVVHGWSGPVAALQREHGREPVMLVSQTGHRSRRTDAVVLGDIRSASTAVRAGIERRLAGRGLRVRGVDAARARLLHAEVLPQRWWVDGALQHLENLVGPVRYVDAPAVTALLSDVDALIVTPLAASAEHPAVNTDADRAAARIATALAVHELVVVTDVAGILIDGAPLPKLCAADLPALRAHISGGMRKKVQATLAAVGAGVDVAVIGRAPISELLAGVSGTVVVA